MPQSQTAQSWSGLPRKRPPKNALSSSGGGLQGDLWGVDYEAAYDRWLVTESPPDWLADRVLAWVVECELYGPPAPPLSVQVFPGDDLYALVIPGTTVSVSYLVVTYERLMIVREFGSS